MDLDVVDKVRCFPLYRGMKTFSSVLCSTGIGMLSSAKADLYITFRNLISFRSLVLYS